MYVLFQRSSQVQNLFFDEGDSREAFHSLTLCAFFVVQGAGQGRQWGLTADGNPIEAGEASWC